MLLISWWNVFHFFWLMEHLYKSWADIFPNFLKSTSIVSYPQTNYLQGSYVRRRNKMSGSEESSQVLIEAPRGTGLYIMCAIYFSLYFSPADRKQCFSPHWQTASYKYGMLSCFLTQHFLSCYSMLANSIQKKFMASLHCPYPLFQRGVLILAHRISQLHQRAVRGWWEPQL